MNFKFLLAATLRFLGAKELSKTEDGKLQLSADQESKILGKFGQVFLEKFKVDLAAFAENATPETQMELDDAVLQLAQRDAEFAAFKSANQTKIDALTEQVKKLSGETVEDDATKLDKTEGGTGMASFKPDMSLVHNIVLQDYLAGRSAQYSGSDTVDVAQLTTEFGKYVTGERMNILKKLTAPTDSIQYMTTIISDKTEVRAAVAEITSVVQQFTPKWTPSAKAKFKPLTIKNRKHKINVPITPADIMDKYLGYMYSEDLTPSAMPIVKYIIEELILPKAEEDREMKMFATGKFVEHTATADGEAGTEPQDSLDGYVTILEDLKTANNTDVTWLLNGVALTRENILEKIDAAVDAVKPLYKKKTMFVHADPDIVTMYGRAYRDKYPTTKNADGNQIKIDFSNFTFAPLAGMQGTGVFFITPKENFVHLLSKDPSQGKLRIEGINYDVKVFGEWWESVGFWLADAIFAYLPPVEIPPVEGV
ncbi:MAG: hypothetical protein PHV20_12415 [Bacteroidales bacterium]|nr:hypothetical protein [Bacteroidales bacterium]